MFILAFVCAWIVSWVTFATHLGRNRQSGVLVEFNRLGSLTERLRPYPVDHGLYVAARSYSVRFRTQRVRVWKYIADDVNIECGECGVSPEL